MYFPAFVYLCVGFLAVEVLLSPKFQDQELGEFALLSVNCTCKVVFPDVGDAEKAATGFTATGFTATVMQFDLVIVLLPAALLAVSTTVYLPAFE